MSLPPPPAQPPAALLREGFTAETCGTCRFGVIIDPANIMERECRGVPPTPILVAAMPAPGGRGVQMQFEQTNPRVASSRPACGLHKGKLVLAG